VQEFILKERLFGLRGVLFGSELAKTTEPCIKFLRERPVSRKVRIQRADARPPYRTRAKGIPDVKVKQFAAEACSLDVASMNDLTEAKRFTLAAALVLAKIGQSLDDVADMFVRLVQRLHNQAYEALLNHQAEHVERTDRLVATLHGGVDELGIAAVTSLEDIHA
jgi:hypothetical protein